MQRGDLVFIMGDPSRPILGERRGVRGLVADLTPITHGTPAVVLEVDRDSPQGVAFAHVKVLVQGEMLWFSDGFVKASNEEG